MAEEPGRGLSRGQQASLKHVSGVEGGHSCSYPSVSPVCYSYCMVLHGPGCRLCISSSALASDLLSWGTQDKDNGLKFELQERELLGTYNK